MVIDKYNDGESEKSKINIKHEHFRFDDKNKPNFYKEGDTLFTYEDIIGEITNPYFEKKK